MTAAQKSRLADEYDAAQERGEVAKHGQKRADTPDGNISADIGLSSKDIHEAREIRDAEQADPGMQLVGASDQNLVGVDDIAQAWASEVVTLAIAAAHGEIAKVDAVDHLQAEAELVGLIEAFGQDEIQQSMALAFDAIWAPRPVGIEARHVA